MHNNDQGSEQDRLVTNFKNFANKIKPIQPQASQTSTVDYSNVLPPINSLFPSIMFLADVQQNAPISNVVSPPKYTVSYADCSSHTLFQPLAEQTAEIEQARSKRKRVFKPTSAKKPRLENDIANLQQTSQTAPHSQSGASSLTFGEVSPVVKPELKIKFVSAQSIKEKIEYEANKTVIPTANNTYWKKFRHAPKNQAAMAPFLGKFKIEKPNSSTPVDNSTSPRFEQS